MTYDIWHWVESERIVIAYIEVSRSRTTPAPLTPFEPIRPAYLVNLMPEHYVGDLEYQQYVGDDGEKICR